MYTVCQYFDELFHCPLNVNFIDVFHPSDIKLAILQLLHSSANGVFLACEVVSCCT